MFCLLSVPLFKVFLPDAAGRTGLVFGDILECRAWSIAAFLVSFCRIIGVSADDANILFHIKFVYKSFADWVSIFVSTAI